MSDQNETTALTTKKNNDVRDLLRSETIMEQCRLALPQHLTPERMVRVMCTSMLRNPKLLDCRRESLVEALMICSQAGIEPDGRNAHLIPYGDKVQVIFDYKGLVAIAERNGVESIYADRVCDNDLFDAFVEEGAKKLKHKVDWKKPRGNAYAYYASCIRGGRLDYEVMTKDEVDAIRKRSKASGSGPWVTDYDEMAKKTVLRRMSKRWDLSPEVREAMTSDADVPDFEVPAVVVKEPSFPGPKRERKAIPTVTTPVQTEKLTPEPVDIGPTTPIEHIISGPGDDLFDAPPENPQLDELKRLMKEKEVTEEALLGFCGQKKLFNAGAEHLANPTLENIKPEKLVHLCQHISSMSNTGKLIKDWKAQ